ncbi:MAG: hypothetical protein RI556_10810 [Hydrogenovibrio sp.]|uniref:cytochrome c biogenesis protein ResB n=1 Tax=Hydrogenovibrio sp. TaxID=2065821 RepID=UPI002870837C|nr:cytochrome c biogenesis protein ResB [Hydrogenovibrio sp.]MDR9499655.1 hypothetical protein [Hydrogenovibrio sp.]
MPRQKKAQQQGLIQVSWVKPLASLKLTLILLLIFALGVITWHFSESAWRNHLIVWPLFMLAINLLAALLTHPTFRNQPWLFMFHLGLLLLLVVVAIGQLTMLLGSVEVTRGTTYDSRAASWDQGYLHPNTLDRLAFELMDFSIRYEPKSGVANRQETRAHLRWKTADGTVKEGVIGDEVGLILEGYRFNTTHNKGFALWFVWQPDRGPQLAGFVHLPAWPAHKHAQAVEWKIPGTSHHLWAHLKFDDPILSDTQPSEFRKPKESQLFVEYAGQRQQLKLGQTMEFSDGRLVYKGLRTWMGFRIFYDWTLPWLLAAGLIAVLGLAGHFWRKYAATPWMEEEA